ncbi:hypothetical protein BG000_004023, partial [Podila horticola]
MQDDRDGEASNHDCGYDSNTPNARSASATDWSSSYESDTESPSRSPQELESSSPSECGDDYESDRTPDSGDEALSDNGSNDAVATQVEELVIGRILSDAGFNAIRAEKRKHHGTSG